MICDNCGISNDPGNKFCTNCGEELHSVDNSSGNFCSSCGAENESGNKFCTSCGNMLKKKIQSASHQQEKSWSNKQKYEHGKNRKIKNRQAEKKKLSVVNIFWITSGIFIAAILAITSFIPDSGSNSVNTRTPVEVKSSNPAVEAKVFEIASKFICSCGSCNYESLEVCTCGRAIEERQFIRDYLEQNHEPENVVIAVANKYGFLKAEFAAQYNMDPSRVWSSNSLIDQKSQIQIPNDLSTPTSSLINTKATLSDRLTIYSAFHCPCGKCSVDELKDCTCNHPNGSVEVKKFIDEKINENKFTVYEIIELVDNKYGGKKT